MTENEYINKEIELWGFEEIESLLEQGFKPVLTDRGYKWLHESHANRASGGLTTAVHSAKLPARREFSRLLAVR